MTDSETNEDNYSRRRSSLGKGKFSFSESLVTIPFFEDLTPQKASKLSNLFDRHTFDTNDLILKENTQSFEFFIIVKGSVALSVTSGSDQVLLKTVYKGEWFGESTLTQSSNETPVSATALGPSILLSISKSNYDKFALKYDLQTGLKTRDPSLDVFVRLQSIPLLSGIEDRHLRQLGVLFEFQRYPVSECICVQGMPKKGLFIVVKGSAEMTFITSSGKEKLLRVLHPFDCFGEASLLQCSIASSTIRATRDCTLLVLCPERFERFELLVPGLREGSYFRQLIHLKMVDSLKTLGIFQSLKRKDVGPLERFDEASLGLLAEMLRFVEFDKGQTIFRQGEEQEAFYIIAKGRVELFSEGTDGNVILEDLGENDYFGENALVHEDSTRATTSAKAVTSLVLLELLREDFKKFSSAAPGICREIATRLGAKTSQRLQSIPFFRGLKENRPWSKLGLLGSMFKLEGFEDGQVVFSKGDKGNKFYVIVEGTVTVRIGETSLFEETLGEGQWFGEMALMLGTVRGASVTAKGPVLLASLADTSFKRFLQVAPELSEPFQAMLRHRTANVLKRFEMFKHLKENRRWSKIDLLSNLFSYETFEKGWKVSRSGREGDKFCIVTYGELEVRCGNQIIEYLKEGDCFGESALMIPSNRYQNVSVTAMSTCVLLVLSSESFRKFLKIAPELDRHIKASLSQRKIPF